MDIQYFRLAMDSPLVTPSAENFHLPSWPPPPDFPIVVDKQGKPVTLYKDSRWNFTPWAKTSFWVHFEHLACNVNDFKIAQENAELLKLIAAWFLYGPYAVQRPNTLRNKITRLRIIFTICTREGILASDLMRFPVVADKIPVEIAPSTGERALEVLHILYEHREQLGFVLLDQEGLRRFEAALQPPPDGQTPYIPPRIWKYQLTQLRSFLDDFNSHRQAIVDCFNFCIGAYSKNAGSLAQVYEKKMTQAYHPFGDHGQVSGVRTGREYHNEFIYTAKRFGIDGLLHKWCGKGTQENRDQGIRLLSQYFGMTTYVGLAYLLNLSLMRISEASSLHCDCLNIEHDEKFGDIYILQGETSKTVADNDARWPTSPLVKIAIDALACIAKLRVSCAEENPNIPTTAEYVLNPHLLTRAFEPWSAKHDAEFSTSVAKGLSGYGEIVSRYPNLFDSKQLQITQSDLDLARLITPTLDSEKFAVGKQWPFSWHQLRRTGAVNMQASGLVSDSSVQYLLKHATRAMTLYYGHGYSRVSFNENARNLYVRTVYEILGRDIANLLSDRFVSPHGEKRKVEILKLVTPSVSKNFEKLAKNGKLSWRVTLLGGCTYNGPCSYGGIDNVARCGGGDGEPACAHALYDRAKASRILQLKSVVESRLIDAPEGSPYRQSLIAQQRAIENALNVIKTDY